MFLVLHGNVFVLDALLVALDSVVLLLQLDPDALQKFLVIAAEVHLLLLPHVH